MTEGQAELTPRASLAARLRLSLLISAAVLPADVLVGYARARIAGSVPGEYLGFGPAGANILRGQLGEVYGDPQNQAGPLELIPYGVAKILAVHGTLGWTVFYAVLTFLACLVLTSVILWPLSTVRGRWVIYPTLGVTLLAVLGSTLPRAMFLGHPADVIIPLVWIAAALLAAERRFVACAVFIGVATGFEVWGILGVPVIMLVGSPRLIRAGLVGLGVVAILYLPFVLTGSFAMFSFHWTIDSRSLWGLVFPDLQAFGWPLRVGQALFALGAGLGSALLFRGNRFGPFAVPFAIVAARLLVDPLLLWYYWLAPASIALVALATTIYWRAWSLGAAALAVVALTWVAADIPTLTAVVLFAFAAVQVIVRRRIAASTVVPALII